MKNTIDLTKAFERINDTIELVNQCYETAGKDLIGGTGRIYSMISILEDITGKKYDYNKDGVFEVVPTAEELGYEQLTLDLGI